jgi:hypothetical protein
MSARTKDEPVDFKGVAALRDAMLDAAVMQIDARKLTIVEAGAAAGDACAALIAMLPPDQRASALDTMFQRMPKQMRGCADQVDAANRRRQN